MNSEEIIQKRREKEAMKPSLCEVRIPFHLYQVAIREAMGRLPEREREALRLRYLKDYAIAAVANSMGVSWDCADSLIDRGLIGIRHYLRRSRFAHTGPVIEPSDDGGRSNGDSQVIDGTQRFGEVRSSSQIVSQKTISHAEVSQ
jgi:hypothetical protein